jgi:protein NrfD
MVPFLFLSHLGVGIVWSLVFVAREAGVKFFRFNAGLAAILIAVALAFRGQEATSRFQEIGLIALAVSEAAVVLYWATVGRTLASIRPAIVAVACVAGLLSLTAQALDAAASTGAAAPLTVASFLSSAAFLGGTCTAMILGHWYLVIPSMRVSHLQSIVKVHMVSMVIRLAVVVAAVVVAIATWQPGLGPSFRYYIFSTSDGVFFWMRALFGLAGPAVLSYLTWETAKIQSTQSATGILYVDFFMVVVGEVLAKYLLLATRVPV